MGFWPIPWLDRLLFFRGRDGDLPIPESTRNFVSLLKLPSRRSAPPGMVYLLATEALSERSAVDAVELIRAVRPGVVVAQVGNGSLASVRSEEEEEGDERVTVPSSVYEVIKASFVDGSQRDSVDSRAAVAVLRSIFGTTYHGPVLSARKAAREAGCAFVFLETPGTKKDDSKDKDGGTIRFGEMVAGLQDVVAAARSGVRELSSSSVMEIYRKGGDECSCSSGEAAAESLSTSSDGAPGNERRSFGEVDLAGRSNPRKLCSSPSDDSVQEVVTVSREVVTAQSKSSSPSSGENQSLVLPGYVARLGSCLKSGGGDDSREFPAYATSFYSLLVDLYDAYCDVPEMNKALDHARSLLFEVEQGGPVEQTVLAGAQNFRLAVESLRIALAAAGLRESSSCSFGRRFRKTPKFEEMSGEDQNDVLVAQALREQAETHGTVVALVDARSVAGIRRQWNTAVAAEVRDRARDCLLVEFDKCGGDFSDGDDKLEKAIVSSGGAVAVVGIASFPWWAPATPFTKVLVLKAPAFVKVGLVHMKRNASVVFVKSVAPLLTPGKTLSAVLKSAASAGKARAAAHSVVATAERATLSAIRTAFYCLMRKKQGMSSGGRPWLLLGGSVAAGGSILWNRDRLEAAIEAAPAAPSVARLGRGLENLERTSKTLRESQQQQEWEKLYRKLYK